MDSVHSTFQELLSVLNRVLAQLITIQQTPREYGTGVALYGSEIHTVQAIGKNAGINVTQLAERMGVTKGAVSQMVSRLVEKGMVQKARAQDNAKEVCLDLTELGRVGFHNHERFDMSVLDAVREHCGSDLEKKLGMFLSVLTDFEAILALHEQRHRSVGSIRESE